MPGIENTQSPGRNDRPFTRVIVCRLMCVDQKRLDALDNLAIRLFPRVRLKFIPICALPYRPNRRNSNGHAVILLRNPTFMLPKTSYDTISRPTDIQKYA